MLPHPALLLRSALPIPSSPLVWGLWLGQNSRRRCRMPVAVGYWVDCSCHPPALRQTIHRLRTLTDKPFGVNLILPLLQEGQIDACLAERVPLLVLFWGDPRPYVAEAHRHATKVFIQVGSVEEATAAAEAGVDAIIVQGVEAGGHVKSRTSLSTLVPAVVEAVAPVPVLAAGGIATGRGVVAALSLGAQAVSMGTRFLCSTEA